MLRGAIDGCAETLVPGFVGSSDPSSTSTKEALGAYAEDHLHHPSERPE